MQGPKTKWERKEATISDSTRRKMAVKTVHVGVCKQYMKIDICDEGSTVPPE